MLNKFQEKAGIGTVDFVAHHSVAEPLSVRANLMLASRLGDDSGKRDSSAATQTLEVCERLLP